MVANDQYDKLSYLTEMSISMAGSFLASRAEKLKTLPMSLKWQEDYMVHMYKCTCGEDNYTFHIANCSSYMFLKDGLDMTGNDHHLVRFYQLVIQEREKEREQAG